MKNPSDNKYFSVGMASNSFSSNLSNKFYKLPFITVMGVSPKTLENYTKNFIYSGECFKKLQEISTPDLLTGQFKQKGYIFAVSYVN